MITLDLTGRAPIYEQICSQFSSLISKGVLKENDKLPSSRMLAKELGLNPNTVAKAYSRLEHDEIIYSVAGKGCFVAKQKGSIEKKLLEEAVEFCEKFGLRFDYINENTKENIEKYGNNTRKVFAHYYIDDKNMTINDLKVKEEGLDPVIWERACRISAEYMV